MSIVIEKMKEHYAFLNKVKATYPCAEYPELYGSSLSEYREREISLNSRLYVEWDKAGLRIQPQTYYSLSEIEKITENLEYYNESLCNYENKLITFKKFVRLLENNRSDFLYKVEDGELYFNCYKEICDNSDKWNPVFKMIFSHQLCFEPLNMCYFLERIEEYLSNRNLNG